MEHGEEFMRLGERSDVKERFYLLSWSNDQGQGGDYGISEVARIKHTLQTLIMTTYMFQAEPNFKVLLDECEMTQDQFLYLQEYDLDTVSFVTKVGALKKRIAVLDLSLFKESEAAWGEAQKLV